MNLLIFPLLAALLASISGGIVGSYVVIKRLSNLCGSISHSVLGGIGFFVWLQKAKHVSWAHPMIGAIAAAFLSAFAIGWIYLRFRQRMDAIIAAIWSTGMATGLIFLSLTPGSGADLSNILLGNLLWISASDLLGLSALALVTVLLVWRFYRSFLAISVDEEQALLQGISVEKFTLLLLALIAIVSVLLIQIIGTLLTIALLTLPATTANLFARRLPSLMVGAIACSALVSSLGMTIAYFFDWPPGAAIALFAACTYGSALFYKIQKRPDRSLTQ